MSFPKNFKARLLENNRLSPDVRLCVFEVRGSDGFVFEPGQHVRVSLAARGQFEDRFFSFAARPQGTRFELCMMQSPDRIGAFLETVKPGTQFSCYGPLGRFCLREPLRHSLFVATGAGIAPVRSMLDSLLSEKKDKTKGKRLTLIYGARSKEQLLFEEEFEQRAAENENFQFWPTISRGRGEWTGRRGRVHAHLEEALDADPAIWDAYICGRPEMVSDARERLLAAGLDQDSLFIEA